MLAAGFHVLKHGRAGDLEMDLGRVEHAQDDDVVTAGTEVAEPGLEQVRGARAGTGDQGRPGRGFLIAAAISSSGLARSVARPSGSR